MRTQNIRDARKARESALPRQHPPRGGEACAFLDIEVRLLDAWAIAEAAPEEFEVPEADAIARICVGSNVLIDLDLEGGLKSMRIWTKVAHTQEDRIFATVENRTGIEGVDLHDPVCFRTRNMLAALSDAGLAEELWITRLNSGLEASPTEAQKLARHLPHYVASRWEEQPDPFEQGADSAQAAASARVDAAKVRAHFLEYPEGLDEMGLDEDDFAPCHFRSRHELHDAAVTDASIAEARAEARDGGEGAASTASMVASGYEMLMNLSLQTKLYADAFDR